MKKKNFLSQYFDFNYIISKKILNFLFDFFFQVENIADNDEQGKKNGPNINWKSYMARRQPSVGMSNPSLQLDRSDLNQSSILSSKLETLSSQATASNSSPASFEQSTSFIPQKSPTHISNNFSYDLQAQNYSEYHKDNDFSYISESQTILLNQQQQSTTSLAIHESPHYLPPIPSAINFAIQFHQFRTF